ncbi:RHS repeat-associated core domain-containing protein [Nocardioides montaniterrae]
MEPVAADGSWVSVPGQPLAVRVPDAVASDLSAPPSEATPSTDVPSASASESSSSAETPSATSSVSASASASPTDAPSTSASASPSESPSTTAPSEAPSVVVGTAGDVADAAAALVGVVQVADPADADAAVASGDPADLAKSDAASVGGVEVRFSYADFSQLYGAGWAERLQVVAHPACFLTTPDEPACSVSVPVELRHEWAGESVRFTTLDPSVVDDAVAAAGVGDTATAPDLSAGPGRSVPAGVSATGTPTPGGGTIYAVGTGAGGYGATPVNAAGKWQVGAGSGEFSYAYPFSMPAPFAGTAPDLSLAYSSGAVDGMTSAVNGQAGPMGLGWSMDPGSITRSYASCSTDGGSSNYDLCWKTTSGGTLVEELTLNLNGHTSRLVRDENAQNTFRLKDDPGWRITRYKSTSPASTAPDNDDNDNEGFRVTTTDGTQYWFGWGRDASNGVLTVPVYGNNSGEPCFNSSVAAPDRWCQQGWRFMLDRVVDPVGNVTKYTYAKEGNYYHRWDTTNTHYDRAAELSKVEYGIDRDTGVARETVNFTLTRRCTQVVANPSASCPDPFLASSASSYPDVPADLMCASTTELACSVAPSFFATYMVTKVVTNSVTGTTATPVDQWDLAYTFPDPDTTADAQSPGKDTKDLWLNAITHTGKDGGTLSTADTTFAGVSLRNRVNPGAERKYYKFRIGEVRNETGGLVQVEYGHQAGHACDDTYVASLAKYASTRECFQAAWLNDADTKDQKWTWFHKYVVKKITLGDKILGYQSGTPGTSALGKLRVITYDYTDDRGVADDPAWRYDDTPNQPDTWASWTDWRGYGVTIVREEDASGTVLSRKRISRYRGLNNTAANTAQASDPSLPRPTARISTLENNGTNEPLDYQWLNGETAEEATQTPSGQVISRTYNQWQPSEITTIDNGDNGTPTTGTGGNARMPVPAFTKTATTLFNPDGSVRSTRNRVVNYLYDLTPGSASVGTGRLLQVEDTGAQASSDDDTCTQYSWAFASNAWIRGTNRTRTYQASCPATGSPADSKLLNDQRTYYDHLETGSGALTQGLVTAVDTAVNDPVSGVGTGNPIRTTTSYDQYGRVTESTAPAYLNDGAGVKTTTSYNPGIAGKPLTKITTVEKNIDGSGTGAGLDLTTTTDLSTGRGLPVKVTDPNGGVTTITYNPLGQPLQIREPGQADADPANISYTYTQAAPGASPPVPSRVKTSTLRSLAGGSIYDDAYTYLDGWGRTVETQTDQPDGDGGRIVALTGYDARGLTYVTAPAIPNPSAAGSGLLNPALSDVVRYATSTFDAAGRTLSTSTKTLGTTVATTGMTYLGDATLGEPATGGVTKTIIDVRGNTTRVELHKTSDPTTIDDASDAVLDAADYAIDGVGQLTGITKTLDDDSGNPVDHTWAYGYDLAGRRIWSYDPDTGATATSYTAGGHPATVTTGHNGPLTGAIDTSSPYAPVIDHPASIITTKYDPAERPTKRLDYTDVADSSDTPITLATWGYDDPAVSNSLGRQTSETTPIANVLKPDGGTDLGEHVAKTLAFDNRGNPTSTSETVPSWIVAGTGDSTTYQWDTVFNQAGELVSQSYPAVPGLPAQTVNYVYTTGGRVASMTTSDGTTTGGHIHLADEVYNNIGQTTALDTGRFNGDPTGRPNQSDGLQRNYTYEAATGRAASMAADVKSTNAATFTGLALGYTYDLAGNPTRISHTQQPTATGAVRSKEFCYDYDPAQRLTRAATGVPGTGCANPRAADVSFPNANENPNYDLAYTYTGDRLSSVTENIPQALTNPATTTYHVGDAGTAGGSPHQTTKLTASGGGILSVLGTANWPRSLPPNANLTYDGQGRITKWTPDLTGATNSGNVDLLNLTDAYISTYDHQGNLAKTTPDSIPAVSQTLATTIRNSYRSDGTRLIMQATSLAEVLKQTTLHLGDGTEIKNNHPGIQTVRDYATPAGTPVATVDASSGADPRWTVRFADLQNSLRLSSITTSDGHATTTQHNYYPYGDPTIASDAQSVANPATPSTRGYLDKPLDPNGDIRLDHRAYNANLSQLTTPDPIFEPGDPLSANPYAYSRNNPISFTDPSGLACHAQGGMDGGYCPISSPAFQGNGTVDNAAGLDSKAQSAANEAVAPAPIVCDGAGVCGVVAGMGPHGPPPPSHPEWLTYELIAFAAPFAAVGCAVAAEGCVAAGLESIPGAEGVASGAVGGGFAGLSRLLEPSDAGGAAAARAANAGARMADGLIGVPQAPMSRALARLQGLRLGDKSIVQGVDAFGSRAGSTFRGRGPTAGSDLDLLVRIDPTALGGRSGPWIQRTLKSIAGDFEAEAGFPLSIHAPGNIGMFEKSIPGVTFVPLG